LNLSICIPARETVHSSFAYDLCLLSTYWYGNAPVGSSINVHLVNGTLIADQRQKLATMALQHNADYALFLDSDMRFPRDLVQRLVAHGKDIVACNYSTRRMPPKTVAWSDFAMQDFVTSHDRSGMEEVDAVGMGAMLVKTEVFRRLPQPWFQVVYSKAARAFIGEDIYFCQLAKGHGFKVYVDHDASKLVRHIGSFEFSHDHVAACAEKDDEGSEKGSESDEGIQERVAS
jgi:hypothetical protein